MTITACANSSGTKHDSGMSDGNPENAISNHSSQVSRTAAGTSSAASEAAREVFKK